MSRSCKPSCVLALLVASLACGSPDTTGEDECGSAKPCPAGFACNDVSRRCQRAAELTTDAASPDAASSDAASPDAESPPDAFVPDAAVDAPAPPDARLELDTTIVNGPPALTASPSAELTFTANVVGATFQCSLDGRSFETCTSPHTYVDLAEGSHTFAVRARVVGAADPTPAMRAWRVDATPPETTIVSGPPPYQDTTEATFAFICDDPPCTFECAMDGGAFASCDPGGTSSLGLTAAEHVFRVLATDAAGNREVAPAERRFTVILGGLTTIITEGPEGVTRDRSATLAFACLLDGDEPPCAFRCTLDGVERDCASPETYGLLAEGGHVFSVRGSLGEVKAAPASATWSIDLTRPTVRITAGPIDEVVGSPVTFDYSASEPARFVCGLNGASADCPASGKTYSLGSGDYTFSVVAIDAAGNRSAPASATFVVDVDGPQVAILSPGASADCAVTLSFQATDPTGSISVRCGFDGEALAPCASGETTMLEAGAHEAAVEATDGLGNGTLVEHAFVVNRRDAMSAPVCTDPNKDPNEPCAVSCECCPEFSCNATLSRCRIVID